VEIANILNGYFVEIARKHKNLTECLKKVESNHSIWKIAITEYTMKKREKTNVRNNMKDKVSAGLDEIPNFIIKMIHKTLNIFFHFLKKSCKIMYNRIISNNDMITTFLKKICLTLLLYRK
jgi:hypothetical protein